MHKLLVADSDSALHDLYHSFFSRHGYEVETVSNGMDCIARIQCCPPSVVCLDMEIPWGGDDVIVELMERYGSIPIILIGQNGGGKGCRAEKIGANVHRFLKPFRFSSLLKVLRTISLTEAEAAECLC